MSKKRTISEHFGSTATTSKKVARSPIFVVCPGAGGDLPRDGTLEAQLGRLGRVAVIPKSTGYDGKKGCCEGKDGSLNVNLRVLTDAVARDAESCPTSEIVLVGQSFGCRAIVHWLSQNHEVRKHPSVPTPWAEAAKPDNYDALRARVRCSLMFGYPLAHASQDRSAALKLLPAPNRALFVIGTSDKMALGADLSTSTLEDVLAETPATTGVVWVPKGGHSPPKASKWASINLNSDLKAFIEEGENGGEGEEEH